MAAYNNPVDIANEACIILGAQLINKSLGFTEQSPRSTAMAECYGKLKVSELERNTWTFSTRKAVLRAIDTNTMVLQPTLWSSQTTYYVGSIVVDANGALWESQVPGNLGNVPGQYGLAGLWDLYFGPLSVALYDSTNAYFSGEIVYTANGDGTYNVFRSLMSQNALDPTMPNSWLSTTTYPRNAVVQQFPAWAGGTTYAVGQGVSYTDGNNYVSIVAGNIGNAPSASPVSWTVIPQVALQSVPVPTAITPQPAQSSPLIEWSALTFYAANAIVLFAGSQYLSLQSNNSNNRPNATGSTFWTRITGATFWLSLFDLNYGNNPTSVPAVWAIGTTYVIGQQVQYTDPNIPGFPPTVYTSLTNGNVGNQPDAAPLSWSTVGLVPWTSSFVGGSGNQQWLQIGGAASPSGVTLVEFAPNYPVNTGPASQVDTRNVYLLPANHLKRAPQDPKAGATHYLGAPTELRYTDWEEENGFIVTRDVQPIVYRFIADMANVQRFSPMFCTGLAARMAEHTCLTITQSTDKKKLALAVYDKIMGEARIKNAIESGSEEPPLDDWIAVRI